MSLQHVPGLAYHQRLSLVQELPTPGPDASNRLSTYAELRSPTMDSSALQRSPSENNLYTPSRRSSFVQHGVATRPSVPQMYADQHSFTKPLPHAYLASLRQHDMPRVETPDEMSHIGAFKLGSLRITNGVASPTPSIERAVTMSAGDDYITAGNLRKMMDHRRDISNRSNTLSVNAERAKSPWHVYDQSPLRKTDVAPQLDIDLEDLATFDFDHSFDLQPAIKSPSRAQELADEYINEIALSPYSFAPSRTPSPQLESTSKNTAIEDELFEAEPLTPALSHAPSISDSGYGGSSRTGSGRTVGSSHQKKPLAKADSGYSSNVSLRSFRTSSHKAPPVPSKEYSPPRESRMASSSYSTSSRAELGRQQSFEFFTQTSQRSQEQTIRPTILTAVAVSSEDLGGQRARQISVSSRKTSFDRSQKHGRSGSDSTTVNKPVQKKDKHRPYSMQPQSLAHDNISAPPVSAAAERHLEDRVNPFPVTAFANTLQRLNMPGNRDTLATIMSVGSGYTDLPVDMSRNKLQEVLASPPSPIISNSYYPPKTPPRRLQKRNSFIHDMEAYENLPVASQVSFDRSTHELLAVQQRSLSFTSNRSSIDRKISSGSRTSSMAGATGAPEEPMRNQSYGSIAGQNPWIDEIEPSPLSAPLQSNFLNVEYNPERRLSWGNRDKRQPPVSMETRRRVSPAPSSINLRSAPPRRPPPVPLHPISKQAPPAPIYAPPPPPPHKSLPPSPLPIQFASPLPSPQTPRSFMQSPEVNYDSWTLQQSYWSDRRQDAHESLQSPPPQQYMEVDQVTRPSNTHRESTSTMQSRSSGRKPPSSHQNGNLRIQRSMEAVKARKMQEMMSSPHLQESYQTAENTRQRDRAGEMLAGWQANPDGSTPGEYHHSFGLNNPISPPPRSPAYFEQPTRHQEERVDVYDYHRRQNSTGEMLGLNVGRYEGGLGYGWDGKGMQGSVGLGGGGERKSVGTSKAYGLDFTDVPVSYNRSGSGTLKELRP